ncbi:MAG: glycosyltransferase [Acidobacteria bacterium]|nr:glycosyltransferase [Acidobacteriota bacterium]MBI3421410.1 glycosyltransferase [Acidobacteriota bacterium]
MRTLYLCYFGVREPLVQTQVIPYLQQLSQQGIDVRLLTFEPDWPRSWASAEVEEWRAKLAAWGIGWQALPYHKWPSLPATMYDIAAGAWVAARLIRREQIDLLHARSIFAGAMGALAKRLSGGRLLLDIRGFVPEEYVDAGIWPKDGLHFRLAKAVERRLLKEAAGFVVLTEQARRVFFSGRGDTDERGRPIEVIPCCVDSERFGAVDGWAREDVRRELGLSGRRVVVYVGALGGWYLTDELAEMLAAAHAQDAATFALVLTQSRAEVMASRLQALGLAPQDYLVRQVTPAEIPRYLKAADVALSLIKPCYSKLASSPTKIAEYLASGLPVISNAGIGDLDELITSERVGVILKEFTTAAYQAALREAELLQQQPDLAARCRAAALKHFDLAAVGGVRYRRLYKRMFEGAGE